MRIPELFAHPEPTTRLQVPSADGTRIHVEVHGQEGATTVVLIHGWTCNITFWSPVIKSLIADAPGLRVVAYDQRGHGGSEAPGRGGYSVPILVEDLTAVLDATVPEGERVVLAGHSMGGMTIMAGGGNAAVLARTGGVVLCSTGFRALPGSSRVVPGLKRLPRANRAAHRFLLGSALPIGPVTPISRAMLKHTALGPNSDRPLQNVNARMIVACPPKSRAGWGRVLTELDVSAQVGKLDVPTSVLFGTADRLTPPHAHAQALADALPDCVGLTTVSGLGHMTPMEAPDVVVSLIRKRVQAMQEQGEQRDAAGEAGAAQVPQQRDAAAQSADGVQSADGTQNANANANGAQNANTSANTNADTNTNVNANGVDQ